jgi:hypothetical protein
VQADVGRHHSDHAHAGEVVSLRHHLGADQHVDSPIAQVPQHPLGVAAPRSRIAVEASDARLGEAGPHLLLEALGAQAEQGGARRAAAAALVRRRDLMLAVVAAQQLLGGVEDQRHVAVRTALRVTALEAHHLGGEAAPVEE